MVKKLIFIITLLILQMAPATIVQAFDCNTLPLEQAYNDAGLVAVGTVTAKEYQGTAGKKKDQTAVVTFDLSQTWKGSVTNELVLYTHDYKCDVLCSGKTFLVDEKYLIYAEADSDGKWSLSHSMCGHTVNIENATDDLNNLDKVARRATIDGFKNRIYNQWVTLSPTTLVIVGASLAMIALLFFFVRSQKKS